MVEYYESYNHRSNIMDWDVILHMQKVEKVRDIHDIGGKINQTSNKNVDSWSDGFFDLLMPVADL